MEINELKNAHAGEELIVLGNGPSLREINFNRLSGKCTFGMNNLASIFNQTEWRPDYYLFQGSVKHEKYAESAKRAISEGITTFIEASKKERYGSSENVVYFKKERIADDRVLSIVNIERLEQRRSADLSNAVNKFWSTELDERVYSYLNSMIPLGQIASYMGFSDIYFVGCDGYEAVKPYMIFPDAADPAKSRANGPVEYLLNSTYPIKAFTNGVIYKLLYNSIGSKVYAKVINDPNYYQGAGHPETTVKIGSEHERRNARLELVHGIIEMAGEDNGFKTYDLTPASNLDIHERASLETVM